MYNFNYTREKLVGRTCLEISLKPFKSFGEEDIRRMCEKLFYDWQKLIDKSESVAVMLWTADGSEIFEYAGELSAAFDYCDVIGIGNPTKKPPYEGCEGNSLHVRPVPYNGERKQMTYGILKTIIHSLKEVGKSLTGKDIAVIETFDPGPEFANSDFKYRRHSEICKSFNNGGMKWLHCASTLHGDTRRYAAYPDGIPEGTHLGEFLGKQLVCLCRDVGFDGIWLSNGFGFSLKSWEWKGEVFDGRRFDSKGIGGVHEAINEFWKHFTAETGDMLIETRGSNLSTGADIAAHGCPIDDIYSYNMLTPPNSPWAALDSRFGLEVSGYLTHIAETSKNGFLFRYYTHDPWWYNSPWFDRYGGSPHDIYLPLALARLDGEGKVTRPFGVNFLSADDSFGNMPERCPNEVVPHILAGFEHYSDAPGIVTWIYPFNDYCEKGLREGKAESILMDDWLIENAIDRGFPVNTVISEKNFLKAEKTAFADTVLVCPVPFEGSLLEKCVLKATEAGLPLILYGNTAKASEKIRSFIGVKQALPVSGELTVSEKVTEDVYTDVGLPDHFIHDPLVSDGGVCEVPTGEGETLLSVTDRDGNERAYLVRSKEHSLVWLRGSFPYDATLPGALPQYFKTENYPVTGLLRAALSVFGFRIGFDTMSYTDKLPLLFFSRHKKGWFVNGFSKDTTVKTVLSFPQGIPLPMNTDCIAENGRGTFISEPWCHKECRIFVKQEKKTKLSCRYETAGETMMNDKRLVLRGLLDAEVRFYPPENHLVHGSATRHLSPAFTDPDEILPDGSVVFRHLSGTYYISWQDKDTEQRYRRSGVILP